MSREDKKQERSTSGQNGQNREFMRETVTHKSGRKKRIRKVAVLVLSAIVFGVLAALTMYVSSSIIKSISAGNSSDEVFVLDEDAADDNDDIDETETVPYQGAVITLEELSLSNDAVRDYVAGMSHGIVSVRADNANGGEGFLSGNVEVPGILWSSTPRTAFILVDYTEMLDCEQFLVKLSTGNEVAGALRAADRTTGLAVIGIDHDVITQSGLEEAFVELGRSNSVTVLDGVAAIGAPYGHVGSAGAGHVVYIDRNVAAVDGDLDYIMTDMNLSGSSFLIDLQGRLVGVSTSELRDEDETVFYGAGSLRSILERLANGRDLALLGVTGSGVTAGMQETGMPRGVYVDSVLRNSPAYEAGIMAGDVITSIEGSAVTTVDGLQDVMFSITAGSPIRVTIARPVRGGYSEQTLTVVTTTR